MDTVINILDVSRRLFYAHGIRRVTMEQIASELGISKKTIYSHFKDKNEIVYAMFKADLVRHKQEFQMIKENSANALIELAGLMRYLCGLYRSINHNLFYDIYKYYRKAWELFLNFKNDYMISSIEANLKQGIEQGLYRENLNIKIISRIRLLQVESMFNPDSFPSQKFDLAEVQKVSLEHFIFGLTTAKGHKTFSRHLMIKDN